MSQVTMAGPPVANVGDSMTIKGWAGKYIVLGVIPGKNGRETHYEVRRLVGNRKQRRKQMRKKS